MRRLLFAFVLCIIAVPAVALSTVRTSNGRTAQVAEGSASKFQCLLNHLESAGVRIGYIGGYRARGSVRSSLHPSGRAMDIDQSGRNRTSAGVRAHGDAAAAACGLIHGSVWRHADAGHFQDGGWSGKSRHHRRHYRHRHRR